ncbi:glycosyltransferase [Sporomusa termitida]|uniref:Glycosyl transferase family 2 n=1 Tax=Sporomusa termitida TaxID=2377 RepID=A0A517DYY1_9FIRM|nr:glycosyltransferase [Sporomusa termitida]QDR82551.1 Glycosyl transferase family 2 [Sporomusa termitida]
MKRILLASPIRQKPAILTEFLACLQLLDQTGFTLEFMFIDDHDSPSVELQQFAAANAGVTVFQGAEQSQAYRCDEQTHYWQEDIVWKVAKYKDYFIRLARERQYDYLFLVDSDLALHPKTITHLVSLGKDLVAEVYWTQWEKELIPLPQVWLGGQYRLHETGDGRPLSEEETGRRQRDFISSLRCPGIYKVGGLGACTLLSKAALAAGIAFRKIENLDLTGEDRHFCVRAAVLGLELYADTCYPPYHMYRESELAGLVTHKEQYDYRQNTPPPRLTLAMLVRNEENRYLEQVLQQAVGYADHVIILDDASTDNTVQVCRRCLAAVPHRIVVNNEAGFHNEIALRKQLWSLAAATNPDWILILDADEIFEDSIVRWLPFLLRNPQADIYHFRLYDMWNKTQYREDNCWQAHLHYRPFLVRYQAGYEYIWQETPQHCGRLPLNPGHLRAVPCQIRLQHWGWSRPADRLDKYYRYKQLDPKALYGSKEQYQSILDPKPNLITWQD